MSTYELENAIFRQTKTSFKLNSFDEDILAVTRLIEQACSVVNIYSHTLCPSIFDTASVIHACEQFTLKNHRTSINILIDESRPITDISHRLLGLSHRHPSSIFFKKIADDIHPREDDFLCIDKSAYFQLPSHSHYSGICNFSDAGRTAQFLAFFNDAWARSEPDPELRSILL